MSLSYTHDCITAGEVVAEEGITTEVAIPCKVVAATGEGTGHTAGVAGVVPSAAAAAAAEGTVVEVAARGTTAIEAAGQTTKLLAAVGIQAISRTEAAGTSQLQHSEAASLGPPFAEQRHSRR